MGKDLVILMWLGGILVILLLLLLIKSFIGG